MSNNYLDEILPFLRNITKERREKFYTYFQNAPVWLIDCFVVEHIKKGTVFIQAGDPVETIYFIGQGTIKGTDRRILGISFDFMIFTDVYAYGGMEVIMDIDCYKISLETVTDCTILKIPKNQFAKWLKSDIRALRYEAKLMGEYLLEQARNTRVFFFLQSSDRLSMLFTTLYEKQVSRGEFKISNDRQALSDYTGLSVKTITRAVQKLESCGLISKKGNTLIISQQQYCEMKKNLAEILSNDD